jgi:hypothetical protein
MIPTRLLWSGSAIVPDVSSFGVDCLVLIIDITLAFRYVRSPRNAQRCNRRRTEG